MRRTLGLLALSLVLFATNATARVEASKLILDAGSELATPTVEILDRTQDLMRVEFTLPALDLQEMSIEGELFQTFAIPGGGQIGEDGQASLPTFSRLVAVPEGVAV